MTKSEAIEIMKSSKDIIEWNANRDLVAITMGIKTKIPNTVSLYHIDPHNENFKWFMGNIDSKLPELCPHLC